jgi:hypothetical protein
MAYVNYYLLRKLLGTKLFTRLHPAVGPHGHGVDLTQILKSQLPAIFTDSSHYIEDLWEMELTRVPSQSNSSPRITPPSSSRELILRAPPIICARVAAQHGATLCWKLMMGTPHLPALSTAGAAGVHALAAWGCSTVWVRASDTSEPRSQRPRCGMRCPQRKATRSA